MLHPFSEDTKDMTVTQIHEKVAELTTKYFQTTNPEVKNQIKTFLDFYKQEALIKEQEEKKKLQEIGNIDLDKLITS